MLKIGLGGKVLWEAFPKQEEALLRLESEVLYGGSRGGGKTAAGIVWLLLGNLTPTGHKCDRGYFLHPNYRALVLRKNVSDMGDWVAKAKLIYGPLGGTYNTRPSEFRWENGATIVIGHLDDASAFEHYQGQEFSRILIEELTQIPSLDLYLKVKASNRCVFDEMRTQMFLTANPGGPGHGWVRERFIVPAPPNSVIVDKESGNTRIFVPARIADNPMLAHDRQYIGHLLELSPSMRRAWLEGDWDAISGQYFEEFRVFPNSALNEPAEARHVIHSAEVKLEPWYHRWLSCDWGYTHNSAVYKFCQAPNGQLHITDEMVMNRTTPEELGLAIGQFIWAELNSSHSQQSWTLFLSPDAFGKRTEERTIADQIAIGIEKIIGQNRVYILPPVTGQESDIFSRAGIQDSAAIVIRRATNQRVPGWMHMKSLMRWWSATPQADDAFDSELALRLHRESPQKAQEYMGMFNKASDILPKLQIHGDKCPKLIRAIPLARANDPDKGDPEDVDSRHFEGMDSLDAARYGLFAQKFMQVLEPFEEFYARHLSKFATGTLESLSGDSKVAMARKAEKDYEKLKGNHSTPIYFPRSRAKAARLASKSTENSI